MFVDFHTHVLPGMDDGSDSVAMSLTMLQTLRRQGTDIVAATSHYHAHRETPEKFLQRRQASVDALCQGAANVDGSSLPKLLLGAEVQVQRDIYHQDLRPLCLQGTNLLLLELPFMEFQPWMLDEIYNISVQQDVMPILAHVERYSAFYSAKAMKELLSLDGVWLQFNHSSGLLTHKGWKLFLRCLKEGMPVVTGSDSHNMTTRAPNNAEAQKYIKVKLGKTALDNYSAFLKNKLEDAALLTLSRS